jgi:uncharacterized protein DUF3435
MNGTTILLYVQFPTLLPWPWQMMHSSLVGLNLHRMSIVLKSQHTTTAYILNGSPKSSTFRYSVVPYVLHRDSEFPDKALPYDTFNQYLQRLGRNAGFEDKLTPYCIRRATANAVDGKPSVFGFNFKLTKSY